MQKFSYFLLAIKGTRTVRTAHRTQNFKKSAPAQLHALLLTTNRRNNSWIFQLLHHPKFIFLEVRVRCKCGHSHIFDVKCGCECGPHTKMRCALVARKKQKWIPSALGPNALSLQDCCCDLRVFNQIDLVNLITEYFNTAQYSFNIPSYLSFKRLPGGKSRRMPPFRYVHLETKKS